MNFLRGSVVFGWVLIALCVVLLIAYPSARPGWGFWADRALVGVAVGLVLGLAIRYAMPQKQRAALMRRLVPTGLGRRFGR